MDRYEPYYATDTDGVHFHVLIDGEFVQAYVSRNTLAIGFGRALDDGNSAVAEFHAHKKVLEAAVMRRVHADGPETVILELYELTGREP